VPKSTGKQADQKSGWLEKLFEKANREKPEYIINGGEKFEFKNSME
jgi:hypothetical protein